MVAKQNVAAVEDAVEFANDLARSHSASARASGDAENPRPATPPAGGVSFEQDTK